MCDNEEVIFKRTTPPSYLSSVLDDDEEIILVHAVNNLNNITGREINLNITENLSQEEFDVTGSPLKTALESKEELFNRTVLTYASNCIKDEDGILPIELNKARLIISNYLQDNMDSPNGDFYIWCICNGEDDERVILLGGKRTKKLFSRSKMKYLGYRPRSDPILSIQSLIDQHVFISGSSEKKVNSRVTCVYEVSGCYIPQYNSEQRLKNVKSLCVNVSWNKCCYEIPDDAKSKMVIQATMGQETSLLYSCWRELVLLELYINILSQLGSQNITDIFLPKSHINKDIDVLESMINIAKNGISSNRYSSRIADMELTDLLLNIEERHNRDCTDHIWEILNHCTTYGLLIDCLNTFFSEIMYHESSIYIDDMNNTTMAQIIKGIKSGTLAVPNLIHTQPLEILIEIGIEKVKKDLMFILYQLNVVNRFQEEKIFQDTKETNSEPSSLARKLLRSSWKPLIDVQCVENQLCKLGQVYSMLECCLLVPASWLNFTAKQLLEISVGPQSPVNKFSEIANKFIEHKIDIPTLEVASYLQSRDPVSWRLVLKSGDKTDEVVSVYHQTQKSILPKNLCKTDYSRLEDELVEDLETKLFYHCTSTVTLVTHLCNDAAADDDNDEEIK